MDKELHEDKKFTNLDFSEKKWSQQEFVNCSFNNCNFLKTNFSNSDFIDCNFNGCNCSLVVLDNTGIKNIKFKDCKLTGIDFGKCDDFLFSVKFDNCQLDYSSFFRKKMKKTLFNLCSLKEVDFVETDLSEVVFDNCDLLSSTFASSILEKTDFRKARNYSFDPELNKIKKAKFSLSGVAGLLTKYNIEIE